MRMGLGWDCRRSDAQPSFHATLAKSPGCIEERDGLAFFTRKAFLCRMGGSHTYSIAVLNATGLGEGVENHRPLMVAGSAAFAQTT